MELCALSLFFAMNFTGVGNILLANEKLEPLGGGVEVITSKEHQFGTDTILLANFAGVRSHEKCGDLGTGCAAIPLWWCRHGVPKSITGVELQVDACDMARRAVKRLGLEEKIEIITADMKEALPATIAKGTYDVVTCNPPYKAKGAGVVSSTGARAIARHESECTITDVIKTAKSMLRVGGRLCMSQRTERLCDTLEAMRIEGIEPKKLRFVQQRGTSAPKLFLLEGKRGARANITVMPVLFIEGEIMGYSGEMAEIYGIYSASGGEE